jgi:hypothetical protein
MSRPAGTKTARWRRSEALAFAAQVLLDPLSADVVGRVSLTTAAEQGRAEGIFFRAGARDPIWLCRKRSPMARSRVGYFRCLLGRTRTLDSHASRLRRKLNGSAETAYVLNVWGVGCRLVATS